MQQDLCQKPSNCLFLWEFIFSSILIIWNENRKLLFFYFFAETIFKVQKLMAHKGESSTSASCCGVCTDSLHLKHKLFLRIIRMKVRSWRKNQYVGKKSLIYYRSKVLNTSVCCERTIISVLLFPVSLYRISLKSMCSTCLSQTYTSCHPCTSFFHLLITSLALCINPSKKALGSWWPVLF